VFCDLFVYLKFFSCCSNPTIASGVDQLVAPGNIHVLGGKPALRACNVL